MPLTAEKKTNVVFLAQDKTGRAFRSMAAETDKLQRKWTGLSLKAAGFVTVAAAAAAGLALLSKRAFDNADRIGKVADAVGISTEALQEYTRAARLSGVESDSLNTGLEQFSKRLGEARQETGSLAEFLKKYDAGMLSAVQSSKNVDEALDLVLKRMAGMADQSDRAALAASAFGRSGIEMANLVRDGADALDEMRQGARDLGQVLSEEMIRQSEAANDALSDMAATIGINLDKVLITLAPTIIAVGDAFARAAPHIATAAEKLAAFFGGIQLLSLDSLRREVAEVDQQIADMIARARSGEAVGEDDVALSRLSQRRAELQKLIETREREIEVIRATGAATNELSDTTSAATRQRAEALLQQLDEQWFSLTGREAELIDMRHEQEMAKLREFLANKAITQAEFDEAEFASRQAAMERLADLREQQREEELSDLERHLQAMRDAEARSAVQMQVIWQSGLSGKLQIGGKVLGQLASLMDSGSKKMFAIGKAAAIAQTIIDTYAAAQTQFKFYSWNPPLAYAAAAAAIAAGLARVRAITSTQFGGGASGAPAGGSPPSGTSPNVPDVPALETQRPAVPRSIIINIPEGSVFTDGWLREVLFPRLQDALDDGTTLRVA